LPTGLLAWVKNDKFLLVTRQELRQEKLRGVNGNFFLLRVFNTPFTLIFPVTKAKEVKASLSITDVVPQKLLISFGFHEIFCAF
jgi:hypothetical protein